MNMEELPAANLIAVLTTEAGLETKARACRQLAVSGDAAAVPALAALLADDRLSDYARTALEGIPAAAAGEALRQALPKLTGRLLAGAVDSLAVRHETAAVPDLIELMKDPAREKDANVLIALGKIASEEAVAYIQQCLTVAKANLPSLTARAVLTAAERLLRDGKREAALGLLDSLTGCNLPVAVSRAVAGLRQRAKRLRLYDGKTLTGWEGDLTWFRPADGAIIAGRLDQPIPRNEFLCTARQFGDFELRLKVRLMAGQGNGGIQFRSQRVPNSREMAGYQADVATGYWGGLYDESRRAKFLGQPTDLAAVKRILKPGDWNSYVIRCEGPRIQLWLNGLLTTEFTEADSTIPQTGFIGLQIHAGAPTEAHYKELELEEL